ncbi:hypothetical protein [Enterococcus sp. LJL51]|uniref:hypothetical protein n=1 Tax=Enterococcus sp. LJL51 TaxID=3416656 RepID=UPI003CEA5C1F
MKLEQAIKQFNDSAIQLGGWMELDRLYLTNRILEWVGGYSDEKTVFSEAAETPIQLFLLIAVKNKKIADTDWEKNQLQKKFQELLTPPPSVVNALFAQYYAKKPADATEYFYNLCCQTGYVAPLERSAAPQNFLGAECSELTETAEERMSGFFSLFHKKQPNPSCYHCFENEGFNGESSVETAASRLIRMNLQGESWGFHYSPAAQFPEQFYISSEEHKPLVWGTAAVQRMLDILDIFPHYFISFDGETRESHGYYQGGAASLPSLAVEAEAFIERKEYPLLNIGVVPGLFPAVQLQGPDKNELIESILFLTSQWKNFKKGAGSKPVIVGRKRENSYTFNLFFINRTQVPVIDDYLAVGENLVPLLSGKVVFRSGKMKSGEIAEQLQQAVDCLSPFEKNHEVASLIQFLHTLED